MKVGELREQLSKLKKEEIIKLAAEFYKLVPKAKKEDYDLDALINNPNKKKAKSSKKGVGSLLELETDIPIFIGHAKVQYYLYPNRVVPKKERSKWRFKVMRWYKELNNTKRADGDIKKQANLLSDLYELLCEACGYVYFSGYDAFQSVQIEQVEFYKSVITLLQQAQGKKDSLKKCIALIVDNYLNRYTLKAELMRELMYTLNVSDLKYEGIEIIKKFLTLNNFKPPKLEKKGIRYVGFFDNASFQTMWKNNELARFGFRFHASLFETEEAINFYKMHYYDKSDEVKLYVLICLLFEHGEKDEIVKEIETAQKAGINPRDRLIELKRNIEHTGKLPQNI